MIIQIGREFLVCDWSDDDAVLTVIDPHRRERVRVTWNSRGRLLSRQQRIDILRAICASGVDGGPREPLTLDRGDADAR